jgi:hypothetical protein
MKGFSCKPIVEFGFFLHHFRYQGSFAAAFFLMD